MKKLQIYKKALDIIKDQFKKMYPYLLIKNIAKKLLNAVRLIRQMRIKLIYIRLKRDIFITSLFKREKNFLMHFFKKQKKNKDC
jgi:hypothetical protein